MQTLFLDSQDGIQHLTIDLTHDWEVQFWTRKLEITEDELRRAVAAGSSRAVQVLHLLTAWSGNRAT